MLWTVVAYSLLTSCCDVLAQMTIRRDAVQLGSVGLYDVLHKLLLRRLARMQ